MNNNNDELNNISIGNMGSNLNGEQTNTPDFNSSLEINSTPTPTINNQIEPVQPLTEETESAMLNMGDNNQITNDSMPSNEFNNVIPSVSPLPSTENPIPEPPPIDYGISQSNSNPFSNEIGIVPPANDSSNNDNKPKKNNKNNRWVKKIIFIIIIVLSLTAVGVGVYILLHLSNGNILSNKANVTPKKVEIEIGSQVSTNISDYADFKNIDSSTCSIDTTNIKDTNSLGAKYTFTITCAGKQYTGDAIIVDTTKPIVKTKDVTISANSTIKALDFIDSCDDKTECSYALKNESTVLNNLKSPGEYDVTIIVKDGSNNEVEVTAKLIVTENVVADLFIVCTHPANENYSTVTKFGIVESQFIKSANRIYTFKLTESEYTSLKASSTDLNNITYQNISGKGAFDDANLTLTITKVVTNDELVAEIGQEIPTNAGELRDFYNSKGYSCNIGY